MSRRIALIVGIDGYPRPFNTPTMGDKDAERVSKLLASNEDGSPNFTCIERFDPTIPVSAQSLCEELRKLLSQDSDVVLFYFSGHGYLDSTGKTYLQTTDRRDAVSLADLTEWTNRGKAKDRILVLDTCNSGGAGGFSMFGSDVAILSEGVSIIASSRHDQVSEASTKGGLLTEIFCDALKGGGTDTLGAVLPALIYQYADRALSEWGQRPLLKCNVASSAEIRRCKPRVNLEILRRLTKHFNDEHTIVELDSSCLPPELGGTGNRSDEFCELVSYAYAFLVTPIGFADMHVAAYKNGSCKLTGLGRKYWRLTKAKRI